MESTDDMDDREPGERLRELALSTYVSFATFRKSGKAVPTPVWCAEQRGDFFIFSAGDTGKVKRLRNGNRAQLALCDLRGGLKGPWMDATAEILSGEADIRQALVALRRKYGVQMWIADAASKLSGKFHKRAYIRVRLQSAEIRPA